MLEIQVFEYRFDDERNLAEASVVHRRGEIGELGGTGRFVQTAALDAGVEDVGDVFDAATQALVVAVFQAYVDALVHRYVGDARTHQAGAQHAQLFHFARFHALVVYAAVLLERGGGEEDAHQVAAHI